MKYIVLDLINLNTTLFFYVFKPGILIRKIKVVIFNLLYKISTNYII